MHVSERIYRWLLRVYPRDFRDEYGEEMSLLFRSRRHEGARLWMQILGDVSLHAPQEHWSMTNQDVRYALRSWRRAPAIPAIALTALTFGIGMNIAIFSVVHAVLLRRLPVPDPARLVLLRESNMTQGLDAVAASLPNYHSWSERARTLQLAAVSGQSLTWTGPEYPERLEALAATSSFASVVGAPLASGRWFRPEEEHLGAHRVAVLSHRVWRTRFASDPEIVGRQVVLNGSGYTVVGVASRAFTVPSDPDVWVPQVIDQTEPRRDNRYLMVLGRLRPEFRITDARAEMASVATDLERDFPESNRNYRVNVTPFAESLVPAEIRTALVVLFAAAALVLLVACANAANVLLSRAAARRKEIAIRTALGAGAARIARQLLTESVLLSGLGAILGIAIAAAVVSLARTMLADVVPRATEITLDVTVLVFALGLGVFTGIGFGLAPLAYVRRDRNAALLQVPGRSDRSPARASLKAALVVGQIALTTVLLVGAGLLLQSLVNLQRVPAGITADSVVTAKLALTRARLQSGAAISAFLSRLTSDLERAPGVRAAGISSAIPLSPGAHTILQAAGDDGSFVTCEWRLVDDGYFRTLQIPLLRGRLPGSQDAANGPRVFVISQQTARTLYGDADPIGRRLRLQNGSSGEVVGVVGDVRMKTLGQPPERVVYFPPSQFGFFPLFNIVVRADRTFEATAALIRDRLKVHDPHLAAFEVHSMQHWMAQSSSLMRIRTRLVTVLGAVALLLGLIGIYGVASYLVAQRAHEFGVRIALGASPSALPLVVVAQGLRYVAAGVGLGVLAAALAVGQIRGLLFEVDPRDPLTFAAVSLFVTVIASCASYVPARRAARVDPLVVLRAE
jgi:putative ABC transport system permease protein